MEPKLVIILLFLTSLVSSSPVSSSTGQYYRCPTKHAFYIRQNLMQSCSSATYPIACRKSLLPYATAIKTNPLKLVSAALSTHSTALESANATLSTFTQLSKTKHITELETVVLKDCIGDIKDSMDEIKSSIEEINGISISADKKFAISNAQTWTSAAITDEDSCLDGFSDGQMNPSVKRKIRNSIVNLATGEVRLESPKSVKRLGSHPGPWIMAYTVQMFTVVFL